MRKLAIVVIVVGIVFTALNCFASVKYVGGYTKSNGTYVSGHYRDTSNDGCVYNNANYLGYNN